MDQQINTNNGIFKSQLYTETNFELGANDGANQRMANQFLNGNMAPNMAQAAANPAISQFQVRFSFQ